MQIILWFFFSLSLSKREFCRQLSNKYYPIYLSSVNDLNTEQPFLLSSQETVWKIDLETTYSKQPYTFYHIGERGVSKHVWVWTWGQLDSSTPCPGWNVETERVTTNSTIIFVYPPKKLSKGAFLSLCNFLFSRNSYIICIMYQLRLIRRHVYY